jgi:hypothetical protein
MPCPHSGCRILIGDNDADVVLEVVLDVLKSGYRATHDGHKRRKGE